MSDQAVVETPKPLTRAEIRGWNADEMKAAILHGRLDEINEVLATPVPTPEEVADAEAQVVVDAQAAAEAQAAADAKAVTDAEAEGLRVAEAARVAAAAPAVPVTPKKIVVDYQAADEDGKPIGRPTHLEAYSWEEMSQKQTEAHVNALRYAERVKNRNVTKKQPDLPTPELTPDELATAVVDLEGTDPVKKAAAIRKLSRTDVLDKKFLEADVAKKDALAASVSYAFMRAHLHDFNPCDANATILTDYINSNDLEWTQDNLEEAFSKVIDQLAPVVQPTPAPPVAEIPPVVPVEAPVPAAEAPVAVAPVVAAPVAPVPNAPAVRVPHAGIQPGTLTAGRLVPVKPAGLTKAQIKAWTSDEMKAYMRKSGGVDEINRVLAGK